MRYIINCVTIPRIKSDDPRYRYNSVNYASDESLVSNTYNRGRIENPLKIISNEVVPIHFSRNIIHEDDCANTFTTAL